MNKASLQTVIGRQPHLPGGEAIDISVPISLFLKLRWCYLQVGSMEVPRAGAQAEALGRGMWGVHVSTKVDTEKESELKSTP